MKYEKEILVFILVVFLLENIKFWWSIKEGECIMNLMLLFHLEIQSENIGAEMRVEF